MGKNETTVLLVSEDADLRARTRTELQALRDDVRVTTVGNLDAAWRFVEDTSPDVIVLENPRVTTRTSPSAHPPLAETVSSLASYAPVVVIGPPEHRGELTALVSA